jgi:hypothetical protein
MMNENASHMGGSTPGKWVPPHSGSTGSISSTPKNNNLPDELRARDAKFDALEGRLQTFVHHTMSAQWRKADSTTLKRHREKMSGWNKFDQHALAAGESRRNLNEENVEPILGAKGWRRKASYRDGSTS